MDPLERLQPLWTSEAALAMSKAPEEGEKEEKETLTIKGDTTASEDNEHASDTISKKE